ncbi:MBL fold metallo-hydrolase [Kosmotoga olearia]|uniref:Beta-lactamase domain protein n=1 Tax=Kosmotoga olearia (strain ATCC BAA-1733 / DSM 21960 / TBF 19.5.1) TaxID=521045 RepID=C5CGX4_KOSOT|nr:MBL fold metallo-hydrolase [Kosmotoga olearia]ACR79639.1 beta-lactamase domain protein [Kosmotoga olearia TBF 19.5.1]MDK2953091.1 7,8-dihydropterin-6-yl-methyl-4-(beta-D-ribofuranosyl)aminobenzene 5-phosphate synthase [Kosmotoga sp.]
MKIWILINDKAKAGFESEHGFSALIEFRDKKIIFDTGQSDVFLKNARKLGLDLRNIDAVVISHGHYDHGNGLESLLRETGPKRIFIGNGFFNHKYGGGKYIGLEHTIDYYEKLGGKFQTIEKDSEIFDGIQLLTAVPMVSFEQPEKRFKVEDESKKLKRDFFEEELYLSLESPEGTIIITGCSHRGIINIMSHLSKDKKIKAIVGGFHLIKKTDEELYKIAESLKAFQFESLYPCHCTGNKAIKILKEIFNSQVNECLSGGFIEIR